MATGQEQLQAGILALESHRGLLSSGDVGHLARDGCLYVNGSDPEMIVSGGEHLLPSEVEELHHRHTDW